MKNAQPVSPYARSGDTASAPLTNQEGQLARTRISNIFCRHLRQTTKHKELFQGQTPRKQRLKEMLKVEANSDCTSNFQVSPELTHQSNILSLSHWKLVKFCEIFQPFPSLY